MKSTRKSGPADRREKIAGRLALAVVCLMTLGPPLFAQPSSSAQSQTMSITLTGQSMIRTDIRAHSPAAVPVIQSLLKGEVIFTNF